MKVKEVCFLLPKVLFNVALKMWNTLLCHKTQLDRG